MSNELINAYIRRRGRHAPPPDRAAVIERELAEARVALDVINGQPEGLARIRHGLAGTSGTNDWGGGPRGPGWRPPEPSFNDVIREIVLRKKGASGA